MEYLYNQITNVFSLERLENYGKLDNADKETVLARYLWNIAISQSLYNLLHIFEIILRNKIDRALISAVGQEDWYNKITFDTYTEDMLNNALEKLAAKNKQPDNGRLIAELNFGFWTSLFNKSFANCKFQAVILKKTFSNYPASQRTHKFLYAKLEKMRMLRNRISHYERIIHWKDLSAQHDLLLEMIKAIDVNAYAIAFETDTFYDIYNSGIAPWKDKVKNTADKLKSASCAEK